MATRPTEPSASKRWAALASAGASACVLLSLDAFGCGSSPEAGYTVGDGGTPVGNGSGSGGGSSSGSVSSSSSGGNVPEGGLVTNQSNDAGPDIDAACPSGAGKYIYVVSDQNDLYTFDPTLVPSATAFTKLGPLNCPGETTPPPDDNSGVNSMAVDRQATAWVNFSPDGKIFKVDTTQPSLPCVDTNYVSGQGGFTPQLGMGFATTAAKAVTEVLYVSDNTGPGGACTNTTPGPGCNGLGLGWIDTTSMKMTTIGSWGSSLAGYNAELSGTGDGLLYGFFTTTPSDIATIDKTSANVSAVTPLSTVDNSQGGYAFSFWGGDFWIYTAYPTAMDPNATTSVTHVVTADGGVSVVMPDIGFTIVGAGSSTCVPTVPPPPPK